MSEYRLHRSTVPPRATELDRKDKFVQNGLVLFYVYRVEVER